MVFLSLDVDYAVQFSGPHFDLHAADRYREFIEQAHQRGLQVEALVGTPEWAARENHRIALAAVDAVIEFNRSGRRAARFDAVHFDVEPYALPRATVASGQAALWAEFLQMISLCATRIRTKRGLRFNCDAPAYVYPVSELDIQKLLVTFNGKEKPVGEHLTDIMDAVTVMDYRNEAAGAGGAIADALPALRYAASRGKTIFLGLETSVEPNETIDFVCGLPRDEFGKRLESSKLGNARFIDGWRLAVFSEDIKHSYRHGRARRARGGGPRSF